MALKAVLTSDEHAAIGEADRAHYSEHEGHFVLDVETVGTVGLEDVGALKKSIQDLRRDNGGLKKKLNLFDGIDADAAKDALARLEEFDNLDLDEKNSEWRKATEERIKSEAERQIKKITEAGTAELGEVTGRLDAVTGQLKKTMIDNAALQELQKVDGNPNLLMPIIRQMTKIEDIEGTFQTRVIDDAGEVRSSGAFHNSAPMTIAELITEMRDSKEYSQAFGAGAASGSGATGSDRSGLNGASNLGGELLISPQDAMDPNKFQAAHTRAAKEGKTVGIAQ